MLKRDLLTRHEAAAYLGVNVATLDRWITSRVLQGTFKVRGTRRVPMSSIEQMIERATPRSRRRAG